MRDIGMTLNQIMRHENCSSIRAFFLYSQNEGDSDVLHKLQSKSSEETCGRLRNSGDIKNTK